MIVFQQFPTYLADAHHRLLTVLFLTVGMTTFPWGAPAFEGSAATDSSSVMTEETTSRVIKAGEYDSLQAAIDAAPSGGAIVKIPPGRYPISQPLVVEKAELRLQGSGAGTHIVNNNEDEAPAIHVRPAEYRNEEGQRSPRIIGVHITDLRVSGNPESGDGIKVQGVNEFYAEGLTVDHNGGNGIVLMDCYENPRIRGSNITYNDATGLLLVREHDIVVAGNEFEENQDALRCLDSYNLTMTGNNLDDHLGHGVVIENTYGSVLSGNMIEESQGTAIILDRDCYGITISSNVLAHNFGGGIDLRDAWGSTVSANTFTIVDNQSLVVGPESGRITITGNNFSNSFVGQAVVREDPSPATGIVLHKTQAITITGNVFGGLSSPAVSGQGSSSQVVIADNVITPRASDSSGSGIDLPFDPDVLDGNSISDQ